MADAFVEACRAAGRLGIRSLALPRRREPLCETTIVRRRRAGRARRAVLVRILRLLLTLFTFTNLGKTTASISIPPLASVASFISNSRPRSQSAAERKVVAEFHGGEAESWSRVRGPGFWIFLPANIPNSLIINDLLALPNFSELCT